MTGSESISRTHWHAFNSSMNLHVAASVTCAFGNLWHPVLNKEYLWLFSFWACNIGAIANLPTGLMSFVTRTDTFPSFFLFLFFFCFVETHLYKLRRKPYAQYNYYFSSEEFPEMAQSFRCTSFSGLLVWNLISTKGWRKKLCTSKFNAFLERSWTFPPCFPHLTSFPPFTDTLRD